MFSIYSIVRYMSSNLQCTFCLIDMKATPFSYFKFLFVIFISYRNFASNKNLIVHCQSSVGTSYFMFTFALKASFFVEKGFCNWNFCSYKYWSSKHTDVLARLNKQAPSPLLILKCVYHTEEINHETQNKYTNILLFLLTLTTYWEP